MRSITAAAICFALFAWVAASPVPSPVTPEDTSEVDNFDSRVSLTLEEMSALHSSTHRPHAPPIVKRSLMVESGPPPADNSDAVVRSAAAAALLRLEAAVAGPLSPQPPPQPHSSSSRRRRQLEGAPADYADNSLSAVPVPSGTEEDDASYTICDD